MTDTLNGRVLVHLSGFDPTADTVTIAEAFARMTDLYCQDGVVMRVDDETGELLPVPGNALVELARERLVTRRAVRGADGRWQTRYVPVELDTMTMRRLVGWNEFVGLEKRLPRV